MCSRWELAPATRRTILGALAKDVYQIEIVAPLAERARETLSALGYRNIQVRTGNGYLGWPEHAPYDCIMVTAAPDEVPTALLQQLKLGGLIVIPVGTVTEELRILRRTVTGTKTLGTLPAAVCTDDEQAWRLIGAPVESRNPSFMLPAAIGRSFARRNFAAKRFWTDNLAQVMRWAAGVDTLGPDDHGLALSTPTTLNRGNSGVEVSMTNHQSWPAACLHDEGGVSFLAP